MKFDDELVINGRKYYRRSDWKDSKVPRGVLEHDCIMLQSSQISHPRRPRGSQSGDVKSPSDFKILSARKLKTLFQKYKLELTLQVFTLALVKFCINIREFLKDTTMAESHENVVWKSEFTFFQRLYSNFNSLTLSSASELFWS